MESGFARFDLIGDRTLSCLKIGAVYFLRAWCHYYSAQFFLEIKTISCFNKTKECIVSWVFLKL